MHARVPVKRSLAWVAPGPVTVVFCLALLLMGACARTSDKTADGTNPSDAEAPFPPTSTSTAPSTNAPPTVPAWKRGCPVPPPLNPNPPPDIGERTRECIQLLNECMAIRGDGDLCVQSAPVCTRRKHRDCCAEGFASFYAQCRTNASRLQAMSAALNVLDNHHGRLRD